MPSTTIIAIVVAVLLSVALIYFSGSSINSVLLTMM